MSTHEELVDAGVRALHDTYVGANHSTNREYAAAVVDAVEDLIRADEREWIAQAIEAAKLDPKVGGRLTVENRDYPLTRDDVLIINGVRNADARIARNVGRDE